MITVFGSPVVFSWRVLWPFKMRMKVTLSAYYLSMRWQKLLLLIFLWTMQAVHKSISMTGPNQNLAFRPDIEFQIKLKHRKKSKLCSHLPIRHLYKLWVISCLAKAYVHRMYGICVLPFGIYTKDTSYTVKNSCDVTHQEMPFDQYY